MLIVYGEMFYVLQSGPSLRITFPAVLVLNYSVFKYIFLFIFILLASSLPS